MIGGHRIAVVALLCICVAAWVVVPERPTAAQTRVVEVRAQQGGPPTAEPPLADGGAPPVQPAATAIVDPPIPQVTVRIRVPATATAGQELTYHIFVDNVSQANAHRVAVRATRPTNAKLVKATPEPDKNVDPIDPQLHWTFGTLESRGSKEITLVVVPDGAGEVSTKALVSFEHGQSVVTRLNKPSVRIRKSGPAEAVMNSPLKYVLEVVNDGSAEAENVVVTESLPEGVKFSDSKPPNNGENPLRWGIARLAPGQRERIEYQVIPTQQGTFTSKATVSIGNGAVVDTATATLVVGQPRLAITKDGPKLGVPGYPLVYTITVKNTGNLSAANVEVLDQLPQDLDPNTKVPFIEFLSATGGGRLDRPNVRWQLGNIPAGESRSVQMRLRVNHIGTYTNWAVVQAEQTLPEKAQSVTYIVDPQQPLSLNIERSRETLHVGEDTIYVVRVINSGNAPLNGVALTLSATENVRFKEPLGATKGKLDQTKPLAEFEPLTNLRPGEIREYTVLVTPLQAGEIKLQASGTVTPAQRGFPVIIADTAKIQAAPLPPP